MENRHYNRRKFLKNATIAGAGIGLISHPLSLFGSPQETKNKKVGIIGLDTSHAVAFTKELNEKKPDFAKGYQVVAAYPKGSLDIESSVKRIPEYVQAVKEMGVEIVSSIEALLEKVDVVFLETNDGRRHLEQAIPVLKAGKPMFIDKPIAASLTDAITIFKLAEHYKVPVFSSSSLRFMASAQEVAKGKIGQVLGADTYGPCSLEKTHPDFFWYGIHGIETLYTVMGTGCKELTRIHTAGTDVAVGIWDDGRIGTFRGTRTGKYAFGGTAFGEKGDASLGPFKGYEPLLRQIIPFFETGKVPVKKEDTLEIFAFMEAADESKLLDGAKVDIQEIMNRAIRQSDKQLKKLI